MGCRWRPLCEAGVAFGKTLHIERMWKREQFAYWLSFFFSANAPVYARALEAVAAYASTLGTEVRVPKAPVIAVGDLFSPVEVGAQ